MPASLRTDDLEISEGSDLNTWAFRYGEEDSGGTKTYPDLSNGWTARAQIRQFVGGPIWFEATEQDYISLEPDGYIYFIIPSAVTEAPEWWDPSRAEGVWDLEIIDGVGGRGVIRFTMGKVTVSANVTRDQEG